MIKFNMPIPARLSVIKGTLALFLIATLGFTWPLWSADRYYPLLPGIDLFSSMHVLISYAIPALLILSLVFVLLFRKPRFFIFLSTALCVALLVADVGRVHYWFYFYLLLLIILLGYNWRVDNINHYASFLNAIKIMLALVYVLAAVQHFNSEFVRTQWPQFIKPFERFWTPEQCAYLLKIAYAIPVIELFIAGGLFFGSTRPVALVFAILFHVFSMVVLFMQLQTESAVILWHFFMILVVLLVFSGTTGAQKTYGFSFGLYPAFALLLFGFALPAYFYMNGKPMKNRMDLMQSNNVSQYIYLSEEGKSKLPLYVQSFALQKEKEYYKLCVTAWAMHETKTKQVLGADHLMKLTWQLSKNYGTDVWVALPAEDIENGKLALK